MRYDRSIVPEQIGFKKLQKSTTSYKEKVREKNATKSVKVESVSSSQHAFCPNQQRSDRAATAATTRAMHLHCRAICGKLLWQCGCIGLFGKAEIHMDNMNP